MGFAHHAHGGWQVFHAAVVEVGRGFGDITQWWHAEEVFVFVFFGYFKQAFVMWCFAVNEIPVRAFDSTEILEGVVGQIYACMTRHAAVANKGFDAAFFLFIQGIDIAV